MSYFWQLDVKAFRGWLAKAGAEVMPSSNTWEVVRFQARGGVHSIHVNKEGRFTAHGFALECVDTFRDNRTPPKMWSDTPKCSGAKKKYRPALLERDGPACFYCGHEMQEHEMTLEHLVSRQVGGPNHLDNMALCHDLCNQKASALPLKQKIELRSKLRAERRREMKSAPSAGFAKLALIRSGT